MDIIYTTKKGEKCMVGKIIYSVIYSLLLLYGSIQFIPYYNILSYFPKQFQEYYIKQEVIKYCQYYNRNYSDGIYTNITQAILIGQKQFPFIHYKKILALISIESHWNIYATNKNSNNTYDYGLTQQNSKFIDIRYNKAKTICNKYNVTYTSSYYDIILNIISAYIYVADIQYYITCPKQQIIAYNTGIKGSYKYNKNSDAFPYYQKFYKIYNL